jgi:hypothetical protein
MFRPFPVIFGQLVIKTTECTNMQCHITFRSQVFFVSYSYWMCREILKALSCANYMIRQTWDPSVALLHCIRMSVLELARNRLERYERRSKLVFFFLFPWASAASHGCTAACWLIVPLALDVPTLATRCPAPTDAFRTLAAEVGTYGRE